MKGLSKSAIHYKSEYCVNWPVYKQKSCINMILNLFPMHGMLTNKTCLFQSNMMVPKAFTFDRFYYRINLYPTWNIIPHVPVTDCLR